MINYKLQTKDDLVITSNDIRDIDKYTIGFSDEDEILKRRGIKGKLKISYVFRGTRELEVAFSDKKRLLEVEFTKENKINIENKIFLEVFHELLIKLHNPEFYNYFMCSSKINDMVKKYVKLISTSYKDEIFFKDKLKSYLSSYLQFREALFIMAKYDQMKTDSELAMKEAEKREEEERIRMEEEEEERERHQEEFYTEDDIKYYGEYMEMRKFPVSDMNKDNKWKR